MWIIKINKNKVDYHLIIIITIAVRMSNYFVLSYSLRFSNFLACYSSMSSINSRCSIRDTKPKTAPRKVDKQRLPWVADFLESLWHRRSFIGLRKKRRSDRANLDSANLEKVETIDKLYSMFFYVVDKKNHTVSLKTAVKFYGRYKGKNILHFYTFFPLGKRKNHRYISRTLKYWATTFFRSSLKNEKCSFC